MPAALTPVVKGSARLNDFVPKSQATQVQKVTVQRNPVVSNSVMLPAAEYPRRQWSALHGTGDMANIFTPHR